MILKNTLPFKILPLALAVGLAGCGDDNLDPDAIDYPQVYEFASHTDPSATSSVQYAKQITRHVLINELEQLIGSEFLLDLGERKGRTVVADLLTNIYKNGTSYLASENIYDQDNPSSGPTPLKSISVDGYNAKQTNFADLTSGVNLMEAMPGLAYRLPIRNESTPSFGEFFGFRLNEVYNHDSLPNLLVNHWIDRIADLHSDKTSGNLNNDATDHNEGNNNYKEILIAYLRYSVSLGEIHNTLLNDEDFAALDNGNTDTAYTAQMHAWDQAFGNAGFSRDARLRSPHANGQQPYFDTNGDGDIDLFSEYNFALALQAYNRDAQASLSDTRFSHNMLDLFLLGRHLIEQIHLDHENADEYRKLLDQTRNQLRRELQDTLVATILFEINNTAIVSEAFKIPGADTDNIRNYAQHWSRLKSTSTALQLDANSLLDREQLRDMQNKVKNTAIKLESQLTQHQEQLFDLRTLLQEEYGFAEANIEEWSLY
jgi:hypothetical protein